jgi:type I restriction enzyme S subunit
MSEWKEYIMKDLVDLKQGFALNKKSDHYLSGDNTGLPLLKISDLINGTETLFVKKSIPKQFLVFPHEIIYSRTGQVGIAFMGKTGVVYNNCFKVIPYENVLPTFLFHWLNMPKTKEYIKSLATGAAQPDLNHDAFKSVKILLPPLPTQQRIASILSAYDDMIENNLKRIKLLEEIAQRTYEEWFVKFRINGVQLEVGENGLPEGWERKKIGTILDKIETSGKTLSSEIKASGKFPVVDQSRDFIAGYIDDEQKLVKTSKPVIIFGDHTRILKFINFPFVRGADGTQVLLSNEFRMPQHLFFHSLLGVDLSNYHYARHFKFLKDCEILIPKKEIALEFENSIEPNYTLITQLRNQNRLLKESRDILLPRLMSGKAGV